MKLNLGCSDDHLQGYVNVDVAQPADMIVDLAFSWPWPASSVDLIKAYDVFEHIEGYVSDGVHPKVHCMNEAWRVLKPGGVLDLAVPCVYLSDGRVNPGAFADPTHISFWTLDDRYYFGEEWNVRDAQGRPQERMRFGPAYGIVARFAGEWKLVDYGVGAEKRSKIKAFLTAVK